MPFTIKLYCAWARWFTDVVLYYYVQDFNVVYIVKYSDTF